MLRDSQHGNISIGAIDLSVQNGFSVNKIIKFIDENIFGFRNYFLNRASSDLENVISFHLVNYLNSCAIVETDGFLPMQFVFVRNPPQNGTQRETDIGVMPISTLQPLDSLIEFESKRLSDTSNNREYVAGSRGGIERFKRGLHGEHLNICGMFAFIQSKKASHWLKLINDWISKEITDNKDSTISWSKQDKLVKEHSIKGGVKYKSLNTRLSKPTLTNFHYFINLTKSKN